MTATLLVDSHTLEDACLPKEQSIALPMLYQFVSVIGVVATLFVLPLFFML